MLSCMATPAHGLLSLECDYANDVPLRTLISLESGIADLLCLGECFGYTLSSLLSNSVR